MATYPGAEIIPYSAPGGVSTIVRDGRLDDAQKELIRKRICKEATDLDLREFFWTCEKYGLNPFGRAQIWAYPRGGKVVIQVGINGDRLIAARSGHYEGQTEPEWCGEDGIWRGFWNWDKPPAAARVGVWRSGARAPTYAVANYREFVQMIDEKDDRGRKTGRRLPIAQWADRPAHMLAKVAESHALRKCFQAEFAELSASFEPTLGEDRPRARTGDLYGPTPEELQQPRREVLPAASPPMFEASAIPRREAVAVERVTPSDDARAEQEAAKREAEAAWERSAPPAASPASEPPEVAAARKAFFGTARGLGLEVPGNADMTRDTIHAALGLPAGNGHLRSWAAQYGWPAAQALLAAGKTVQDWRDGWRPAADDEEPTILTDDEEPEQGEFGLGVPAQHTDPDSVRPGGRRS